MRRRDRVAGSSEPGLRSRETLPRGWRRRASSLRDPREPPGTATARTSPRIGSSGPGVDAALGGLGARLRRLPAGAGARAPRRPPGIDKADVDDVLAEAVPSDRSRSLPRSGRPSSITAIRFARRFGLLQVLGGQQIVVPSATSRSMTSQSPKPAGRVEAGGRLVEEQDLGAADQARGEVEAAAHAPGVTFGAGAAAGSERVGRVARQSSARCACGGPAHVEQAGRPSPKVLAAGKVLVHGPRTGR